MYVYYTLIKAVYTCKCNNVNRESILTRDSACTADRRSQNRNLGGIFSGKFKVGAKNLGGELSDDKRVSSTDKC